MNTKLYWLSLIAVILSFVGGFILANALNRKEMNLLRADNEKLKKNAVENPPNQAELELSDEEIRRKIAEADSNPGNFSFQKDLGLGLSRYGGMKKDVKLISESKRLLERAYQNNPKDYELTVALGNVNFDIGYFQTDLESFKKAREFYQKALDQKPEDADVRTDLALTYYLAQPPEFEKTVAELQKSLQSNPKHQRALQFMTRALIKQNKAAEAEKYLARLREINPQTPNLNEFTSQMTQEENKPQK